MATGLTKPEQNEPGSAVKPQNFLREAIRKANESGKRLVVPLAGFPGLNLTRCSVKLAQQNYGEHYKVIKAIADAFHPDAVFPLMDLSVEANAIGRFTVFPKEESATVMRDDFGLADISAAVRVNVSFDTRLLGYVETLKLMNLGLPPAILRGAYVTGPYTLAALIMGAEEAAAATIEQPETLHAVCSLAMSKIQQYARLLVSAGAQIICVLEPSAVMLGPRHFEEFSSAYVRKICETSVDTGVSTVYHVCGKSMHLVEAMAASGVDALSLDSEDAGVDLPAVARMIPKEIILIGNLNPTGPILHGTPDDVERDVKRLLNGMTNCHNFILSTGCDLPQETPERNISAFMKAGRDYRLI